MNKEKNNKNYYGRFSLLLVFTQPSTNCCLDIRLQNNRRKNKPLREKENLKYHVIKLKRFNNVIIIGRTVPK